MGEDHVHIEGAGPHLTLPTQCNGPSLSEKHHDSEPKRSDTDEKDPHHDVRDANREQVKHSWASLPIERR
jgi:hypothetical protein